MYAFRIKQNCRLDPPAHIIRHWKFAGAVTERNCYGTGYRYLLLRSRNISIYEAFMFVSASACAKMVCFTFYRPSGLSPAFTLPFSVSFVRLNTRETRGPAASSLASVLTECWYSLWQSPNISTTSPARRAKVQRKFGSSVRRNVNWHGFGGQGESEFELML